MAHDADTDSDLTRPPVDKHPSAWNATPAMLLRSATRRRAAGNVVALQGPSESEWGHRGAMDGSCSDDSEIEEERAGGGAGGRGLEQESRGRIRADDVYPECERIKGTAWATFVDVSSFELNQRVSSPDT
jgi:hypothetical protein